MSRAIVILVLLPVLIATAAAPAGATDRHTAPTISKVKRNAAGRVVSCTLECTLLETGRGSNARLSFHRVGAYDKALPRLGDSARRQIISGTYRARSKALRPLWVSDDITKTGHATPVSLDLDFGPAGLEGSEDPTMEIVVASAHTHGKFSTRVDPHVHAAPTAPVVAPDKDYFVRFPKGTKAKPAIQAAE